ncbi:hypothetical protein [Actinomadura pelletieri]|uniref:hypothetical protein n=1 Tax=Actinomadura pelletieri TaxID=111805 RepID=UPI001B8626F7|nr:hypothetical protein [Actinomadura pelletieri]
MDEFGPLNPMPRTDKAWQPLRNPRRLRATCHRKDGVRHMFGALDLATGKLYYRIRRRKRWRGFLSFLKSLNRRWHNQNATPKTSFVASSPIRSRTSYPSKVA